MMTILILLQDKRGLGYEYKAFSRAWCSGSFNSKRADLFGWCITEKGMVACFAYIRQTMKLIPI